MTGEQARAARKLIGLSIFSLSRRAGLPAHALETFERNGVMVQSPYRGSPDRINALHRYLVDAGIVFESDSVRLLNKSSITPDQAKAARLLLGWSIDRLATRARMPASALRQFEQCGVMPRSQRPSVSGRLAQLRAALLAAGVEIAGEEASGVRFREGRGMTRPEQRYQ